MQTQIVAEIGQNHNGSMELALLLIDAAVEAGCDFVKFQKRDPELAVPKEQQGVPKETPWGTMTYLDYRKHLEFDKSEFDVIDGHCQKKGIGWFASAWDIPRVEFLLKYDPEYIKVPSAKLTEDGLLTYLRKHPSRQNQKPIVILSTGMSTMAEIYHAVGKLGPINPVLMHCTSTYPCPHKELNLRMITTLQKTFPNQIGYSGHESGLATTVATIALGVTMVERHITLDRTMWGSDHAASIEPNGLRRLVDDIRAVEVALGDGIKKIEPGEIEPRRRLRGA